MSKGLPVVSFFFWVSDYSPWPLVEAFGGHARPTYPLLEAFRRERGFVGIFVWRCDLADVGGLNE
jgi:hypothetical protein